MLTFCWNNLHLVLWHNCLSQRVSYWVYFIEIHLQRKYEEFTETYEWVSERDILILLAIITILSSIIKLFLLMNDFTRRLLYYSLNEWEELLKCDEHQKKKKRIIVDGCVRSSDYFFIKSISQNDFFNLDFWGFKVYWIFFFINLDFDAHSIEITRVNVKLWVEFCLFTL